MIFRSINPDENPSDDEGSPVMTRHGPMDDLEDHDLGRTPSGWVPQFRGFDWIVILMYLWDMAYQSP